jgi:hypothetical protein
VRRLIVSAEIGPSGCSAQVKHDINPLPRSHGRDGGSGPSAGGVGCAMVVVPDLGIRGRSGSLYFYDCFIS